MFRRVVVIGLDGFEPTIVESLVASGDLPHLSRLASVTGIRRVATTFPAQTPVAWSTFATGLNPGGHGIFDFIHRDPESYSPVVALNRYEQKSAFSPPKAVNLRRGIAVWQRLSDAGIPSAVIRCPCTYPADPIRGRMLSGMGVPDLLGGFGTGTFYSTASNVEQKESESFVAITLDGETVATTIAGPRLARRTERSSVPIRLFISEDRHSVVVQSAGDPSKLKVSRDEWSDWLKLTFPLGMLQSVRGMVRFRLISIEPEMQLYASPVNFDPSQPMFPISTPDVYSAELERRIGTYYTTGMVEDHAGLNNGRFDEEAFLDQCALVLDEREQMLSLEVDRTPEGMVYCLFDTPDRLQHMMWRCRDRLHPTWNEVDANRFGKVIEEHYRNCDAIVGRVLDRVDSETLLIVMSDHGFGSFRRGVNINRWLQQQGLLSYESDQPAELSNVDWSRTRAFALGLGSIYLNRRGREASGIVEGDEARTLQGEIASGLRGLVDPKTGNESILRVVCREDVYDGPYEAESPDLIVGFGEGYRASWSTALGGAGETVFEDNMTKWSGDHIVDPRLVPGFLVANHPLKRTPIDMRDLCPTIMDSFQLPIPSELEGRSMLERE